jgi:hypothetical protein
MPHITIEYVIMLPLLIMQIFLFPMTASWLMNTWVNSRRTLALQDVAGHLGSTMQQLYFSLNHTTMPPGKASYYPGLPPLIEDIIYKGTATLQTLSGPELNAVKALELTVTLMGTTNSVTTTIILGPDVNWRPSVFLSNSTNAYITAEKFVNGTISLQFNG